MVAMAEGRVGGLDFVSVREGTHGRREEQGGVAEARGQQGVWAESWFSRALMDLGTHRIQPRRSPLPG